MRRWLMRLLMAAMAFGLCLGLGLWALLATAPGAQLALKVGLQFVPGEVHYEQLSGNLWQGVEIHEIRYSHAQLNASLEHLQVAAHLPALWRAEPVVHLTSLSARGLSLRLLAGDTPKPAEKRQAVLPDSPEEVWDFLGLDMPAQLELPLPLAIRLDDAAIEDITVTLDTGPEWRIDQLQLAGAAARHQLEIDSLTLLAAGNRVQASGRIDSQLDLNLALAAPQLAQIRADVQGHMALAIDLAGTLGEPIARVRGQLREARLPGVSVHTLVVDLDVGIDPARDIRVRLDWHDGQIGEALAISRAQLRGQGTAAEHRLELSLDSDLAKTVVVVDGGLAAGPRWQGAITRWDLEQPQLGSWKHTGAAPLLIGPAGAQLRDLCFRQEAAQLCVSSEGRFSGEGRVDVTLTDLHWAQLDGLLPELLDLEGRLNLEAQLQRDGDLSAQLRISSAQGFLRIPETVDVEDVIREISYEDLLVNAQWASGELIADFALGFLDGGDMRGDARLLTDAGMQSPLEARLLMDLEEIGWLPVLVPGIQNPQGRLSGHLTVGGTLASPELGGEFGLTEGRVQIPVAGIEVRDINLSICQCENNQLELTGRASSGTGYLELGGHIRLTADGQLPIRLTVQGEDFEVSRRPDIEADISPDLELWVIGRYVIINGTLGVPRASVSLTDLPPQAVAVSRDEIIIDDDAAAAEPLFLVARVSAQLGEDVRISGYGLDARLVGDVAIEEQPGLPRRMFGEIRIAEGSYRAYGQRLTVERGNIIFQGPTDNPGLSIRASREVPAHNVTVGLEITGTVDQLRSRLFANPPTGETDTLSLLITGQPLSGAGQGNADALVSAIAVLGIERGGFITDRMGQELGLDEFRIDTGTDLEGAALVMGR